MNGLRHGFGKYTSADRQVLRGHMGAGCEGGKRQAETKVGTVYNGAFAGDLREGDKLIRYPDGTSFTGIFKKTCLTQVDYVEKTAALTRCRRGVTSLCCTTAPANPRRKEIKDKKVGVCYDYMAKEAVEKATSVVPSRSEPEGGQAEQMQ